MHPEEIKAQLRMRRVTLTALADSLGVSRSMVSHVICGKARSARIQRRIGELLGKNVNAIWPPVQPLRRTGSALPQRGAA